MKARVFSILLIEDNPGDQRLVREMLDECGHGQFRLLLADQIMTAMPVLDREKVDLILLDLRLPDGDGLGSLEKIAALATGIPVVVLSEADDEAMAVKAVRQGAQDFLVKQHISGPLLIRSLRYALERRQLEEQLYHLAHHDALTGLANRKLFYERLTRALASARRHQRILALMLLDLNGFKQINDSHGHHVGDELLRQVAGRLGACLRETDCAARLGGDEFIVFVSDLGDAQDAGRVARKVLGALASPYRIDGCDHVVHTSLGIAIHPSDGDDIDVLVKRADAAMYMAKANGREASRFRFYSRSLDEAAGERMALEEALRQAMANGEFVLNYQPQVDLHSGRVIGVEALLRWRRGGELVTAARFMPALEESGLIVPVGEWVIGEVCRQAVAWRQAGLAPIKLAVNVSPRQFRDPRLADRIARIVRDSGLEPHWLELELSEESLHEDEELALDRLWRLDAVGVRLAIDNYRGHSASLRDLQRFPIHAIKLDRSIVQEMTTNPENAAIVRAVISVAHVFKMKGVAEGVETAAQADLLRSHACDDAQGYAFGKPLAAEAISQMLGGPNNLH